MNVLSIVWSWGRLYCKFVIKISAYSFIFFIMQSHHLTGHTVYIQCQALCVLEAVSFI